MMKGRVIFLTIKNGISSGVGNATYSNDSSWLAVE